MAAIHGIGLGIAAGGLGFLLATLVAFLTGRFGTRLDALAGMVLLAFIALVFGLLSAGIVEGDTTIWNWGAAAAYVWLPASAGILVGGFVGWTAGAPRGG
jgi:hypothetical protein